MSRPSFAGRGLLRTYQSLDPVLFGRSNRIVIGKHSGLSAITSLLSDLQLPASAEEQRGILARVREHAVYNKGPVARETVTRIWREVCDPRLPNCA